MDPRQQAAARRGLTAIDGAVALIVLLLVVQMWLLTATLETTLAGHLEAALPATLVSALLFVATAGLALFVRRVDRDARVRPR